MIAYADTGFLISLYGPDDHSVVATALVLSKPISILMALGDADRDRVCLRPDSPPCACIAAEASQEYIWAEKICPHLQRPMLDARLGWLSRMCCMERRRLLLVYGRITVAPGSAGPLETHFG